MPSRRKRTRGQSVVEFALVVPFSCFVLLIAVDFGRLFFSYIQIENAAREAAAYGATSPTDISGMQARAIQEKNSQGQRGESAIVVTSTCANQAGAGISCTGAAGGSGAGNTLTVRVSQAFTFLTPIISGFFGGGLQVQTSATAAVLGTAPESGGSNPGGCAAPTLHSPSRRQA